MNRKERIRHLLDSPSSLDWLQGWYFAMCNGDWEHGFGPTISTLDNPGWEFVVQLQDTDLEGKEFNTVRLERNEHDWIFCSVANNQFQAAGGPLNLDEMIGIFRDWATPNTTIYEHPDFEGE